MMQKRKTLHLQKTGNGSAKTWLFVTIAIVAMLTAMASPAWAKLTISVSTSPAPEADHKVHVRPGSAFTYTVSVSADQSTSFNPPKLAHSNEFQNQGESTSSETSATFANGTIETKQTKSYSYELVPTHQGTFTIGPATVKAGSKVYKSNSVVVKVDPKAPVDTSGGGGSGMSNFFGSGQSDDDAFSKLLQEQFGGLFRPTPGLPSAHSKNLYFIQAVVNRHKAYVGQQVTVTFYLVTRAQIADIDTLKYPDLKGFWKEDIDVATQLNFEPINVNGVTYQRALLASYALFPLHAGISKIDPYQTKCEVVVANNMGLPQTTSMVEQSGEIPIEVKALPKAGMPANFTGGVGEFTASASIDDPHTSVGQPVTLTLRVQGKGNAKLVQMPKLSLGPDVQTYDSKSNMKFSPDGHSYNQVQSLIVPQKPGTITIPPFDFWFFNPKQKRYYESKTNAITVQVDPGNGKTPFANPATTLATGVSTANAPAKSGLPDVLLSSSHASRLSQISAGHAVEIWSSLWGLSALALGAFAWQQLRDGDRREDLLEKINRRMKTLDAAAGSGNFRQVGRVATETIHQVLGEIAGLGGASYEFERMAEQAPPSFKRELVPPLRSLLARLEVVAYAPDGMIGAQKEKPELKKLVQETRRLLSQAAQYDFSTNRNPMRSSDREHK